jgi:hypothetical protein
MLVYEPSYKKIIRYINYQKIEVDLDILLDIRKISHSDNHINNITFNQLKRIKKLINIFSEINNIEYYIFILEILPNYILRNIYRNFSYKWNKILNQIIIDKKENKENKEIHKNKNLCKLKHNIIDITETKNIKDLLVKEFEYLKKKNQKFQNFFITCINDFFI